MRSFSEFHDGLFDGLLVRGASLSIFVNTFSKQEFVLEVSGVLSLKVDGFRQGNIIYDLLVREAWEVTLDDMMTPYEFKDQAKARMKLEETRQNNLAVVEINPSYGATCFVLAKAFDLIRRHEWAARLNPNSADRVTEVCSEG